MIPASVGFQCPECVRAGQAGMRAPKRGSALRSAGRRWGPVTVSLIAANVAMFVVTAVSAGLVGSNPLMRNYASPVFDDLAQVPFLVDAGEWWRLISAAFLHFGPIHLALNMLALLVFGSQLELQLGRLRFAAVYLLSILGGAAAIQLFAAPNVFAAGASTAIWGLMGAFAVLMVAHRQDLRGIVTLLVLNLLISVLVPGISLIGHLGGLVAGALTTALLVLARRNRAVQVGGVAVLGVALLVLALAVPTVV
jgi:membrane associated rhomboid family serine protease